jgi:transcription elongation factor GreA
MNSSRDQTVLTDEGRKRLTERARRLRDETIPALISAIEAAEQDASLQMELDLAGNELQRLTYLLETARSTDAIPEDPDVVQVGDWVTIVSEDDGPSRYLIVHPAEAGVDVDRVSSESPLAQAVLGHRVGDEVEVQAPTRRYAVTIAEVLRERSGS